MLSDDSTTISCPSQPCTTLSRYLLDNNGTLPVGSNVEYHFLPGEHYHGTTVIIEFVNNFTISGATNNGSLLTVHVGW